MAKVIHIIGDGLTEKAYIDSIRDIVKNKPTKVHEASSIKKLKSAIDKCIKDGISLVICLIDMDNKVPDGKYDHDANAIKYNELKQKYHNKTFINRKTEEETRIIMLESYPCTEIFFLYYGEYTTMSKTNDGLKSELKRKYGYEVSASYFNRHSLHEEVFSCRGGSLNKAISNARKSVNNHNKDDIHSSYSELYILFDELGLVE